MERRDQAQREQREHERKQREYAASDIGKYEIRIKEDADKVCDVCDQGKPAEALIAMNSAQSFAEQGLLRRLLGTDPAVSAAQPKVLGHLLRLLDICSRKFKEAHCLQQLAKFVPDLAMAAKRHRKCTPGSTCRGSHANECVLCCLRGVFKEADRFNTLKTDMLSALEDKQKERTPPQRRQALGTPISRPSRPRPRQNLAEKFNRAHGAGRREP